MTFFLIIATVLVALMIEWVLASLFAPLAFSFRLSPFVVFFWFTRLPLAKRLCLAFAAGWVFDSLSVEPFGTALFALFVLALAMQPFQTFFDQEESRAGRLLIAFFFTLLFFLITPFLSGVAGML